MVHIDSTTLFQTHKDLLFAIAYRMLGTANDAEDIVQDTFVDVQQAGFRRDVKDEKAYLCKIVYNKCKDYMSKTARARSAYRGPWLPEPMLTEDPAERVLFQESLATAYLILLLQLSETERSIFVLRQVGSFNYAEISYIVEKSEANCRQIYRRAKQSIGQIELRSMPDPTRTRLLIEQFVYALQNGDIAKLMELLADDIVFAADSGGQVPGSLVPVRTAERTARFLMKTSGFVPTGMITEIEQVNGQWGLVLSLGADILYVFSFQLHNDRIQAIYATVNPDKLIYIRRQKNRV
ncbi:sigma-70 family RNA polymerase sigma factor [Paenibacillus sp. JCM 10914]|uniref:sigma-70 family RNA polymerase sigma factor n=1 Tax=Paenibacillus sp. JCM 10914 TaxID=1236974 RepID=UPI000689DD3F|nr:sigma-70 family RNA polymerase sigma factor [Paenibacillus sp. JCM 10914]